MVKNSILLSIEGSASRRQKLPLTALPGWSIGGAILLSVAGAGATPIDLGSTSGFALLAGAAITINGAASITGDIGTYPGLPVNGLASAVLTGTVHSGDTAAHQAQIDLLAAYTDAAGRAPNTTFTPIYDLGGQTFLPGVYRDSTSLAITGTVTLDAQGNPNAFWIFQAGTTLITGYGSQVVLTGGAQAANVFWQVGTSATLGGASQFAGDILAQQSATLNSGALVVGRILAQQGAITLAGSSVHLPSINPPATVPERSDTVILFGFALATLFTVKYRLSKPAMTVAPANLG